MRIDAHAHFYPERFLDLIERQGDKHPVEVRREGAGGERKLIVAGREFFTFLPDFFDLGVRLEQMAAAAVDMQVLSLGPPMVYWAEPELGAELCQAFNDEIASIVRRHPDKFVTLAAARMIFAGVLEKYPDLRLCLSHAGGMALWIQGRFDHGLRALPACQGIIERPPSEYLKRMYFDTITHNPEALRYVIDRVGADRLALGTDYPFAVADYDPVGTVDAIPGLTEDERETIAGGAAAALLDLA